MTTRTRARTAIPHAVSPLPWDALPRSLRDLGDELWRELALCRQVDPDTWYPEQGDSVLPAKTICARCTVRASCLEVALRTKEAHGVWGGMSAPERRALRRVPA